MRWLTEDEMVRWHHRLKGHEFEQTPRGSDGQEAWHAAVHVAAESQIQLSDLGTTKTQETRKETKE